MFFQTSRLVPPILWNLEASATAMTVEDGVYRRHPPAGDREHMNLPPNQRDGGHLAAGRRKARNQHKRGYGAGAGTRQESCDVPPGVGLNKVKVNLNDGEGFDEEGVDDEGDADEGVDDEGIDDEGVDEEGVDDEGFEDKGVGDEGVDGVDDEGVDDEGADEGVADEGVDDEWLMMELIMRGLMVKVMMKGSWEFS
ncbi:unnamed protein product [Boreogadus saida]